MNIGIDARLLYNETGIGRYTRSLFFEFAQHDQQDDTYYLLYDKEFPGPFEHLLGHNRDDCVASLPSNFHLIAAHCKTRILWTNWYVPQLLRQQNMDVYHGVCNFELPVRKMCRYVVTIHDLVPLFFPKLVPWKHLLFFKLFMKRAAKTADIIITDSKHSKQDIIHHLAVPEEKIRVIYLGYKPRHKNDNEQRSLQDVLIHYGIVQPYLLFVGVIEPKKNLERIVQAFSLLRQRIALGKKLQLVIVGGKGWFYKDLYQKVQELCLNKDIIFTGFVPDEDLPYLYTGAEVFVFPSIYEGFGLPVVEAMSYGVPVVTSNVSSLPEIVGNTGILVDPKNPKAICEGIAEVFSDPQKQAQMRQNGPVQAQQFSWTRTAAETYKVYQEVYQME
jgi:glycosyltransferase involved in cell wall biosynthesis